MVRSFRRSVRHGLLVLSSLCIGVVACVPDPDVVSTLVTPEASTLNLKPVHGCLEGRYKGTFNDSTADGATQVFHLSGDIEFRLERSGSGEFLHVAGAQLTGNSDQGYHFSADIVSSVDGGGGDCREGSFTVYLAHGVFYAPFADVLVPVPFYGTVEGDYQADKKTFVGTWKVYLTNSAPPRDEQANPQSQGTWQALWHGT